MGLLHPRLAILARTTGSSQSRSCCTTTSLTKDGAEVRKGQVRRKHDGAPCLGGLPSLGTATAACAGRANHPPPFSRSCAPVITTTSLLHKDCLQVQKAIWRASGASPKLGGTYNAWIWPSAVVYEDGRQSPPLFVPSRIRQECTHRHNILYLKTTMVLSFDNTCLTLLTMAPQEHKAFKRACKAARPFR